jgi:hypothetical protein
MPSISEWFEQLHGLHCETATVSMLDEIVWRFENALFAGEEVRSKRAAINRDLRSFSRTSEKEA